MNSYLESGFYIINSKYELVTFNHILSEKYPEMEAGVHCYKVLNGTSSPCSHCPIYNHSNRNQVVFYSEKQGHWISSSFAKLDNSDKVLVITTSATDEMKQAEELHRSELEQMNKELTQTLNVNKIFLNSMPPDFVACAIVSLTDGSQRRLLRRGMEITEVEVSLLWDDFLRDVINAHMTEPEQIENMQSTAQLSMLRKHKPGDILRYDYFTSYQSSDGTPKPVSTILTFFEQNGFPYMNIFTTGNVKVEYEKKLKEEVEILRLQDVKRREELEKALSMAQSANKAKSDFLSNVSHDIRTPMNAIVGITNLMCNEEGLSEKLKGYIQKIQLSSQHLLGLINDVLDMSKIEANEVSLNMDSIDLPYQIGQVDSIIRARAMERGQIFRTRFHKIWHNHLLGDDLRLRQVLINLLSNAVKYTQRGGHIEFDIEELPCKIEDHARFRFIVTDNGCGMASEFLERIFDPFVRSEASVTNKIQGTGLGMAITKNIVELMDGEIHIDSTLGKGTHIEVELELKIDCDSVDQTDVQSLLLITEDEILKFNMENYFRPLETFFCTAVTKEEILQQLDAHHFDVVIFAGFLYDKNLSNKIFWLREHLPEDTLIFCLDYVRQTKDTTLASDADGFLMRPFFLESFHASVLQVRNQKGSYKAKRSGLEGMCFLCAEDNVLNAEILEALLKMRGASCKIYPDGAELVKAFQYVKSGEYDAILMDIQMPNMNGLEAAKAIRRGENPLGKTLPIIAMTANAFIEDIQQSMAAGMNAHISKPIDIVLLEKTIRSFSDGNRHLQGNFQTSKNNELLSATK